MRAWAVLPLVVALVAGAVWAWGQVARLRAESARMAVTRDRYGNPVSARAVARQAGAVDAYTALQMATAMEVQVAPYRTLRGVDALTQTPAAVAALPEPEPDAPQVVIDSPAEWLLWLKDRPHALYAAESGGGKSVTASVVLDFLLTSGATVVVIDCHWSPMVESDEGNLVPKWGGVAPMARSAREAREALRTLRAEYDQRMAQLSAGEVVEGRFPPIFILVDETPELVRELAKLDRADIDAKRAPRGTNTWDDAIVILGSGGRKVNMHGHLLTQSPLVEDIGMNSAMRKNFLRIALAHAECRKLIGEEPDRDRKAALLEALRGRRYPAAVERNGEVWLLSRDGLLDMMPERINAPAWQAPSVRPQEIAPPVSGEILEPARTDGRTDGGEMMDRDRLLRLLRILRQRGMSREEARETLMARGIRFENSLWTEAGRKA